MQLDKMNKNVCFVLLPGFSVDNFSVLGLKKALENFGYNAIATNFFGEKKVDDFLNLTMEESVANISELINKSSDKCERVFGIGISLGGALLMEHAKKFDNLSGIVSIGTPFRLKKRKLISLSQLLFPILYPIWKQLQKIKKLQLVPYGASEQVVSYLEGKFLENLNAVTVPILFLHSQKDGVTDYRALEEYVPVLSGERKEIIYFKNGNHVINDDPEIIARHAMNFFKLN